MNNEQPLDKPAVTGRKSSRDQKPSEPQLPQILSPLSNNGPELLRDSHC
jgi:hypothetical protein